MSHYLERFGRKMSFFLLTAAWNSPPQTVGGRGFTWLLFFFRIKQQVKCSKSNDTVDGRYPGQYHEHEIYETLSKMGYYPYQLVSRTSSINSMLGS